MSLKIKKTHLKKMVKEAIQEVLLEARSLSSLYGGQFAVVARKVKDLTKKIVHLEQLYEKDTFNRTFLAFSREIFQDIFGLPEDRAGIRFFTPMNTIFYRTWRSHFRKH